MGTVITYIQYKDGDKEILFPEGTVKQKPIRKIISAIESDEQVESLRSYTLSQLFKIIDYKCKKYPC